MKVCSTSNREVTTDFIEFTLPGSKEKVRRSLWCRATSKPYHVKDIDFTGP